VVPRAELFFTQFTQIFILAEFYLRLKFT